MKTKVIPLFCLLVFFCCSNLSSKEAGNEKNIPTKGTINVYCTPDIYDLTSTWAQHYSRSNPGQDIIVNKVGYQEITGLINKGENLCFMSNETQSAEKLKSGFQLVVGREIFVTVISSRNPYLAEIEKKGISPEALALSLAAPGKMQWGTLLDNGENVPLRFFIVNDDLTKAGVAAFLKSDQASLSGIKTETRDRLISAIQNDPYSIGFCRMTDILQPDNAGFTENIRLLPIDKNGNGKLDYMENIYADFGDFSRGVWIGKYPKVMTNNLYCIAKTQPSNEIEVAFLGWVLTSGQDLLPATGYSDLVSTERQSQMNKLARTSIYTESPVETNSTAKLVLLLFVAAAALTLILDLVIRRYKDKKGEHKHIISGQPPVFNESNMNIPKGLYFDKTHTWAFMEQDGYVKVGIDDFLQHVTGPITSIGMKSPGVRVNKGDQLCILIQNGKHLIIYSPVSGTIREQNTLLSANSSMINSSPYSEGWVCRIEPSNWLRETTFLSMADQYRVWLHGEFTRLKDFLAFAVRVDSPTYAPVILQDGGMLKDHILADFGPEVWEDFQTGFINTVK